MLRLVSTEIHTVMYFSKYWRDTFDSSNAIDGLKSDLSVFRGQCAISAGGYKEATWWVNLTSIHSIHDIRIYYRTDNNDWGSSNGFTSRFLGFYVYVSNTTDKLDGHLCFHDTNYSTKTIPAVVDINCTVHGQYVIYYNERPQNSPHSRQYSPDAHVELCEVEVNGCNKTGYYGRNCSLPCPTNCQHGYCHIETGVCLSCSPGYHGQQCKLQCDGGRYGQDCEDRCGACLGYKQCHHINGSCLGGCDTGYEGDLCKSGCSDGRFGINCEHKCNENCGVPYECNRATGESEGGCQPG
ncbi:multiple epidermal growth factor-like domains protein 10 [Saccostrea cucullata]|uniref:multiple epidermal growth factor-like domains protein 10 n=1 Tax=Saccostrea cuccullata TaxID=36930 RepID=UPI002ED555F4